MDVLILTEEQAAELTVASDGQKRQVIPRRLADGRLILNADILTDDWFVGLGKRWRGTLTTAAATVGARVTLTKGELEAVQI